MQDVAQIQIYVHVFGHMRHFGILMTLVVKNNSLRDCPENLGKS